MNPISIHDCSKYSFPIVADLVDKDVLQQSVIFSIEEKK